MKIKGKNTQISLFFVIYNHKKPKINRDMRSVLNVHPGDSVDVKFPEGFELEYKRAVMDENGDIIQCIFASICTRMNAYYWDNDDHRRLDFYFYNDNEESEGILGVSHFAKFRDLTPDSRKKVEEFVRSNYKK